MLEDRWPPVYDAEDLAREIRQLTARPDFEKFFYEWRADRSIKLVDGVCQGDVVTLDSGVPVIAGDGHPGVITNQTRMWLVLGNTCDFHRSVADVRWTQVAPLRNLGGTELHPSVRDALRKYSQSRAFYVPPWEDAVETQYHAAELPLTVAIDKRAFTNSVRVQARLSRPAWILFNACLLRFVARDDGRFAE